MNMQEIYVDNLKEVIINKKKFEKELSVKLSNKGKNVFIEGGSEDEYLALEILKAINLGFSMNSSLQLKQEGVMLQTLNIKDITKRNDLERIRARIIGTKGRTLKTLSNLTNCSISLHYNKIGIIGDSEEIKDAVDSIKSLIQGSKQGNVYSRLERRRKEKKLRFRNMMPEE